ncbi:MAG: FKBP-type peptidyl-prolyl cis-trans isomerase [Candidatus Thorarchaeota archaeon]|jgi:FKBP-type peptidyl-prolyl cis-trans isomerase 2
MSKKKSTKTKKKPAKKKAAKKPAKKRTKKAKAETVVGEKSLVYIDYSATTKDDGVVFDTTMEAVAKDSGIFRENDRYEPMLVAIGWNWLLEALEEELIGMKVGDFKTVEVPPEKGAGPKDPKKVKMIAKTKLAKHKTRPIKGEQITFGNERGVITAVFGRQVRVDFNSPLAGRTLEFDVTLRSIVTDPIEKLGAVVKRRMPGIPDDNFKFSIAKKIITIEMPKETRYIQDVQYAEIGIAADALKVFDDAKEVKLVVTFDRPKENVT